MTERIVSEVVLLLTFVVYVLRTSVERKRLLKKFNDAARSRESRLGGMIGCEIFLAHCKGILDDLQQLKQALTTTDAQAHRVAWRTGEVGELYSLISKGESVRKLSDEEQRWMNSSLLTLAQIGVQSKASGNYEQTVLSSLAVSVQAVRGLVYIESSAGSGCFRVACSYAASTLRLESFQYGDGLHGQCVKDMEEMINRPCPSAFAGMESGLGSSSSVFFSLFPLKNDDQCVGILELYSVTAFSQIQVEFLSRACDQIASFVHTRLQHERTEKLLAESEKLTLQLEHNAYVLNDNMSRLETARQEMQFKQKELDAVISSLAMMELDPQSRILSVNQMFCSLSGLSETELLGRFYHDLLPKGTNDATQFELMWSNFSSGRTFSGEFRIRALNDTELWLIGNFTPILDHHGILSKVMLVCLFNTEEKVKFIDLKDSLNALRKCVGVAEIDEALKLKSANDIFLSTLNLRRSQIYRLSASDLVCGCHSDLLSNAFGSENEVIDGISLRSEKDGISASFSTTFVRTGSNGTRTKKGFLILNERAYVSSR